MSATAPDYSKSYVYAGGRLLMTWTKDPVTQTEKQEFTHPDLVGNKIVSDGGTGGIYTDSKLPCGTKIASETTGASNPVYPGTERSSATGLDSAPGGTYSSGQCKNIGPGNSGGGGSGNPQGNNGYSNHTPTTGGAENKLCAPEWLWVPNPYYDPADLMLEAAPGQWVDITDYRNCGNGNDTGNPPPPPDHRKDFDSAVDKVRNILKTSNSCSSYFGNNTGNTTAAVNALNAFAAKAQFGILPNRKTGIEQHSDRQHPTQAFDQYGTPYTVSPGKSPPAAYIVYGQVTINTFGPFFNAGGGVRFGGYVDAGVRSQVLQILHELAHVTLDAKGHPLILPDGKDTDLSEKNTELIKGKCKTEIEAAGKW